MLIICSTGVQGMSEMLHCFDEMTHFLVKIIHAWLPRFFYENNLLWAFFVQFFNVSAASISLMTESWKLLRLLIFSVFPSSLWKIRKIRITSFDIYLFILLKISSTCFQSRSDSFLICVFFSSPLFFLSCFRGYELQEDKVVRTFFLFKVLLIYGRLISCPTFALIYTGVIPTEGKRNYCH